MSKLIVDTVESPNGGVSNFRQVGATYNYSLPTDPKEQLDAIPTWCNRIEVKFNSVKSISNTQVIWFTFGDSSGVAISPFAPNAGDVQASWQAGTVVDGQSNTNISTVYDNTGGSTIFNTGTMYAERIYPASEIWRCYGNGLYREGTQFSAISGTWVTETEQVDLSSTPPAYFGLTGQLGTVPLFGKWTTYYHSY